MRLAILGQGSASATTCNCALSPVLSDISSQTIGVRLAPTGPGWADWAPAEWGPAVSGFDTACIEALVLEAGGGMLLGAGSMLGRPAGNNARREESAQPPRRQHPAGPRRP